MENTLEILFFNCLTSFHWTLLENVDGFGLAIPKLRENTLFYISDEFLEAFLKFQQVDSDSGTMENTVEIIIVQLFGKLPLNIV